MQSFVATQIAYLLNRAGAAAQAAVQTHVADTGNPHQVTAAQVGATPAAHATAANNPHSVTAAQVGATPIAHATAVNNPHAVTVVQALLSVFAAASGRQKLSAALNDTEVDIDDLGTTDYIVWFYHDYEGLGPAPAVTLGAKSSDKFVLTCATPNPDSYVDWLVVRASQ